MVPVGNIQVMRTETKGVQLSPDMKQQTNNTIMGYLPRCSILNADRKTSVYMPLDLRYFC